MLQVTDREDAFLKAESDRLGISIAELMRRILDEYIDRVSGATRPSGREPAKGGRS
jgi:hypothetical protein